MEISSLTVYGHGSGSIILRTDSGHTTFDLTAEENERMLRLARDIADERRAQLVKDMQTPFPALADYTEIPPAPTPFNHDAEDDIPF